MELKQTDSRVTLTLPTTGRQLPGVELKDVTLETLSQEVVVGLMGASVMNPKSPWRLVLESSLWSGKQ